MKRLRYLTPLVLVCALAACGGSGDSDQGSAETPVTTVASSTPSVGIPSKKPTQPPIVTSGANAPDAATTDGATDAAPSASGSETAEATPSAKADQAIAAADAAMAEADAILSENI